MSLRITGGRARGRVLRGALAKGVRPTGARVREALFSMLGQDLTGQTFLDAFSGSGLMALEAWSRGAEAMAVDRDSRAARQIRDRAEQLGATVQVTVGDILRLVPSLPAFTVVYADPPFALDPLPIVNALAPVVGERLLLESERSTPVPDAIAGLIRQRRKEFGRVVVHFFERPS